MNKLFYIFLSLLSPTVLCGQYYLTPDSSVLRINKVEKLTVINCLDSSFCFRDEFEFNKKGLMTKEAPAMVAFYSTWEYYDNGNIKTNYTLVSSLYNNEDSIFLVDHYHYNKNWKFKWIISDQYKDGNIVSIDTLYKPRPGKKVEGIQNQKGQIIEQQLGDLYFPCGNIFRGRHKIYYEYNDDGLLKSAKVLDDTEKLIINFAYSYEYY